LTVKNHGLRRGEFPQDAEDAEKTEGNCYPVPLRGADRYRFNGRVECNGNGSVNGKDARLKGKSRRPLQSQKRLCAVEGGECYKCTSGDD
jgi:hypothetical protein